jgi:hypothetical protein
MRDKSWSLSIFLKPKETFGIGNTHNTRLLAEAVLFQANAREFEG